MNTFRHSLEHELARLVQASSWFMQALRAVRQLELASWCIGAGAVRSLVWDRLHHVVAPSPLSDIDVVYYDDVDTRVEHDAELRERLVAYLPGVPWEVTNQATVHRWLEEHQGHPVQPFRSLDEAIASWPEYATCVGICLQPDDSLRVFAPHGLDELFSMTVRHNPTRASVQTYLQRVRQKRYVERWPKVTVVPIES